MSTRQKILIIDDEKDFCLFIKEVLEITGKYEVSIATSGKSGIRASRYRKPDLILLDIIMPKMDGFEVLKELKQNKRTLSIPVIMLTAKVNDDSKTRAASLYDEDYIVKPVKVDELRSKIDNTLSTRG